MWHNFIEFCEHHPTIAEPCGEHYEVQGFIQTAKMVVIYKLDEILVKCYNVEKILQQE